MTITRISLTNFKRFEQFSLTAREGNILVGPNNSGKSSILDALRVLAYCLRFAKSKPPRPMSIEGAVYAGYDIALPALPIPSANITRNYSDEPAELVFTHKSGAKLKIELGGIRQSRFYILDDVRQARTSPSFLAAFPAEILVIPDLAPFEAEERQVTDETIRKNRSTRLAARSFRNIWRTAGAADFSEFKGLVEASWPGVSIQPPEWEGGSSPIQMFFSESRRDREIFWAGYGFQIWLQILTHMLRASSSAILVMDEPDVYLHADLQKRLLKLIEGRFEQYFLATHSAEIINEAEVGSVASINPSRSSAKRIASEEDFQAVYSYIGSSENAELAKLVRAKRIIFFEGEDKKTIKKLAARLGFVRMARDTDALIVPVGGFSRWRRVADAEWALRQVLQIEAKIFALFDRDYRCELELDEVRRGLEGKGIDCRIWSRKEIENYLLEPACLVRLVEKLGSRINVEIPRDTIIGLLYDISDSFRDLVNKQLSEHHMAVWRGRPGAVEGEVEIQAKVSASWATLEGRFQLIPGKQFLKQLSAHLKDQFNISITPNLIIDEIKPIEMANDLKEILGDLEKFCSDEVSDTLRAMEEISSQGAY